VRPRGRGVTVYRPALLLHVGLHGSGLGVTDVSFGGAAPSLRFSTQANYVLTVR
jgi:hypothetical protein